MTGICVAGTGKYAPPLTVDNEGFAGFVETSDEWITTRTGIKKRHFSEGEPTWLMGAKAARAAFADAGIDGSEIDLVLGTTVTPDFFFPSLSALVAKELGLSHVAAIDINCACAGFVTAVDMARRYLATGDVNTVLIVSAENLSKLVDFTERGTCVLFGDGAGAAVIRRGDGVFASYLSSQPSGAAGVFARGIPAGNVFSKSVNPQEHDGFPDASAHFTTMDGREVYKFTMRAIPEAVAKACERAGIAPAELDWIVPHQANLRIVETAASKMGLPLEKFYMNIEEYGNTSSASIPICLAEMREKGLLTRGQKICVVGFGAGLVYAGAVFEW